MPRPARLQLLSWAFARQSSREGVNLAIACPAPQLAWTSGPRVGPAHQRTSATLKADEWWRVWSILSLGRQGNQVSRQIENQISLRATIKLKPRFAWPGLLLCSFVFAELSFASEGLCSAANIGCCLRLRRFRTAVCLTLQACEFVVYLRTCHIWQMFRYKLYLFIPYQWHDR